MSFLDAVFLTVLHNRRWDQYRLRRVLVERGIKVTTMTYYEGAYTLFMGYSHSKLTDVCRRLRFIGGWQVYQHPIFNWRGWPPYVLLFPSVSMRCLLSPSDMPNNTHTLRGLPFHPREVGDRLSWLPYSLRTPVSQERFFAVISTESCNPSPTLATWQ